MFHIAPVYNWLRGLQVLGGRTAYEKQMLANYLKKKKV